jgi:hypothetical protein
MILQVKHLLTVICGNNSYKIKEQMIPKKDETTDLCNMILLSEEKKSIIQRRGRQT